MNEPHIFTTCRTCGGRASAQQGVLGNYTHGADDHGVWLHMNPDDWTDAPHPVVPEPGHQAELDAAIASYWEEIRR